MLSRLFKTLFILLLSIALLILVFKSSIFDTSKNPDMPILSNNQTVSTPSNKVTDFQPQQHQNKNDKSELSTLLNQYIVAHNKQYSVVEYTRFFEYWMSKEPNKVMVYLLNLNNENFRLSMLLIAMITWSDIDSDELNAWLWLMQASATLDLDRAISLLSQSENISPRLAIQYADKINDEKLREISIIHIIQTWVKFDAASVVNWVNQNNQNFQQYAIQTYSLVIEADIDTALLSLYLLSDKDPSVTASIADTIREKIFQLVSSEEFDADNIALALLSLPNNDFSDSIIEDIVPLILSHISTESALALIDNIESNELRGMMQQKMVGILVDKDIDAALNFINYFENDDKREQAFDTVISYWAKQDLSAASDWLSSVDIGDSHAGFSLAQIAVQKKDINIAQKWIRKIEHTYDVDEMHYLIFNLLYQEDVDSAVNYLNQYTDFSEQEVFTILNAKN